MSNQIHPYRAPHFRECGTRSGRSSGRPDDRRPRLFDGELKHNRGSPGQAARALKLPINRYHDGRDSMWGRRSPSSSRHCRRGDRRSLLSQRLRRRARGSRLAATGRKKLIFAGISLEVCAAFPASPPWARAGAYVAVDASGTFSETKRQAGLLRMLRPASFSLTTRP